MSSMLEKTIKKDSFSGIADKNGSSLGAQLETRHRRGNEMNQK